MFGGGSSTPFGSPSGGFGSSNTTPAFGSPAPAQFGAPAPSAFGGFGAPAPAPSAFGGFGAPAPAPTGGFGGFGAPAPAPSAFGGSGFGAAPTSSPFGAPAPVGGGLFGSSPAPASGGLFGSAPAPATGGFGASTFGGGGFGATSATPAFGGGSTFGAPAPAPTGLFGSSPAPATGGFGSGFGATTSAFGAAPAPSTGLFGAPAPAPSTGLFGSPAPPLGGGAGGGGTKIAPYTVTNRQDGTSNINLQAITAMPAYENKSFEELRFEDYSQGNRGAGGGAPATSAFGGFGAPAPAPSGGLFGAPSSTPAFGAPAPAPSAFGGFGSPAPAPFGSPSPAPFGAPAPAPFGAPAPAPFGAPAPGAFGSTAFGAKPPAPGGLFGAPAPSSTGLFGSAPAPATGGLFGSTPSPAPLGFGSPAPAPSLFGAPAPAPFGSPAPAPFGAPAPSPFGGFGAPAPAPSNSLFGAPAPSSAFGAPSMGGSLFGAPAPSPGGGLFGAPAPAGSNFFGAPAPAAPAPYGFGAPAPPPAYGSYGSYGAPAPPPAMPAPPPVGSIIPPSTDEIIAAQVAALEKSRKEMEKSDLFRKKSSETSIVTGVSLSERDSWGALTPARAPYSAYRASPKSTAKVRPRGFASPDKTPTPSLSRLGSGGKPMAAPDTMAASSATRLIINPSPKPKLKLSLQSDPTAPSPFKISNGSSPGAGGLGQTPKPVGTPATPAPMSTPGGVNTPNGRSNKGYDYYQQVIGSPSDEAAGTPKRTSAAPKLSKPGYICTPPIDVLATLPAEDLAAVPNFAVERPGVGKIEWEGAVDIRGVDLDSVVIIEPKSASVYMKEEEENLKPPVGTKLNRSAVITLEGVYAPEDSQEKFTKKVERQTKKMGAQLIEYDGSNGVWRLRVQHFSRYALDEDDDSSSEVDVEPKVHFESGEREGRSRAKVGGIQRQATPYKPPRVLKSVAVVVEDDDEEMESSSDVETALVSKAEDAFEALRATMEAQTKAGKQRKEETAEFSEESGLMSQPAPASRYVPTMEDLGAASSSGGICSRIAQEAGFKNSSIDFGQRMERSFRVGWSPDGSFMCQDKDGNLVRRRPQFTESRPSSGDYISFLKQHQQNSEKIGDKGSCPLFALPSGSGLGKALNSYVEHSGSQSGGVAKESFALLKCLGKGGNDSASDALALPTEVGSDDEEARRLFAIQQWLVDSCSAEVASEVKTAIMKNEKYAALLAAISGGDIEHACGVADELGFQQLASMLAAGPEGRADILSAVMAWTDSGAASKMPDDLIRSYFVLGGDLKMEDDIFKRRFSPFDWRRRLAMTLTYASKTSISSVSSLVTEYENNVARGYAPYPRPRYLQEKNAEIECVSYSLLRLGRHELEVPLRKIVDPKGHTASLHDFSLAFHLAAAVSAMGCSSPLSEEEEEMLIDGYASQLASEGYWEWAVYVLLCQFSPGSSSTYSWKQSRAKVMVLQNFTKSLTDRRRFLEGIGVPSWWFEEALALRCANRSDNLGYLSHMVNVDPNEACASLEYTLVPNMFFMNKADLTGARLILDAFSVDSSSLAGAVFDFFQIHEDIVRLEHVSQSEIDAAVPTLLERCEQVERTFVSYQSGEAKLQGPTLRIVPEKKTVPMACFLAEGLSQISLFKLQLRALKSQMSISSTATQILNLAQPSDMIDSGISARENILRWLM